MLELSPDWYMFPSVHFRKRNLDGLEAQVGNMILQVFATVVEVQLHYMPVEHVRVLVPGSAEILLVVVEVENSLLELVVEILCCSAVPNSVHPVVALPLDIPLASVEVEEVAGLVAGHNYPQLQA